jgi:hypothetical protein
MRQATRCGIVSWEPPLLPYVLESFALDEQRLQVQACLPFRTAQQRSSRWTLYNVQDQVDDPTGKQEEYLRLIAIVPRSRRVQIIPDVPQSLERWQGETTIWAARKSISAAQACT